MEPAKNFGQKGFFQNRPARRTELTLQQRAKENEVLVDPDTENNALGEFEDEAIKDKPNRHTLKKEKLPKRELEMTESIKSTHQRLKGKVETS